MAITTLRCPSDSTHNRFTVTVPVYQVWVVDERTSYIETDNECVLVDHILSEQDYYMCQECGADAIVSSKIIENDIHGDIE